MQNFPWWPLTPLKGAGAFTVVFVLLFNVAAWCGIVYAVTYTARAAWGG